MTCAQIGDTIQEVVTRCGIPELILRDWGSEVVEKYIYGSEEALTILFFVNGILERIGS